MVTYFLLILEVAKNATCQWLICLQHQNVKCGISMVGNLSLTIISI
nr:MAG TPA: hypothetical protein [Caudoviricetes sp.]